MRVKALIYPTTADLVPITGVYSGRHPDLQIGDGEDYLPDKYEVEVVDGEETTTEVRNRDFSGITDSTHNIDRVLQEPVAKEALPGTIDKTTAAVGEDVTISGLPEGTDGKVNGGGAGERIAPFTDGELILSFDSPATYTVTLRHPLHLDRTWEVIVS